MDPDGRMDGMDGRRQNYIPPTSSGDKKYEPQHEISYNVVCATSKGSDQPAHRCSLIRAFASRLIIL